MYVGALLSWWYSKGWLRQLAVCRRYLARVADFFSIPLLVRTLFQPFRQIDNTSGSGSLDMMFRGWIDRTVSRFIGAMARSVMIILGSLWWCLSALGGVIWCLLWPLLPFLPFAGLALSLGGGA